MLQQYEAVCYELLRPAEVQRRRAEAPISYVPLGSLEWHLWPHRVDLEELRTRGLAKEDRMQMSGPEGIGGLSPLTHASAELGRKIIRRCAELIGKRAAEMLAKPAVG
jgi:creatinine amidohydrolase/Fe(II)-dependent formamide hydrolase-like protein